MDPGDKGLARVWFIVTPGKPPPPHRNAESPPARQGLVNKSSVFSGSNGVHASRQRDPGRRWMGRHTHWPGDPGRFSLQTCGIPLCWEGSRQAAGWAHRGQGSRWGAPLQPQGSRWQGPQCSAVSVPLLELASSSPETKCRVCGLCSARCHSFNGPPHTGTSLPGLCHANLDNRSSWPELCRSLQAVQFNVC